MKAFTFLVVVILTLGVFGFANAQETPRVWVDIDEIMGLTLDRRIPIGGTDLVIPVHFKNVDEPRTNIVNGFKILTDNVSTGSITGEWNPAYPWNWELAFGAGCYPPACYPYFDQGTFINYSTDGLFFAGLVGTMGTGLPADFDGIACYITINDVDGDPCGSLTLDSLMFMEPANDAWCWGPILFPGECLVSPEWGGPYQLMAEGLPCGLPPVIVPTTCGEATVGVPWICDIDVAGGYPFPEFSLMQAPEGMTIDPITGVISWLPTEPGVYAICVVASNTYGTDEMCFTVTVTSPIVAYTTCWPQPSQLSPKVNDGILNIIIHNENNASVKLETVLVQGMIPPLTEARIEGDSIVTDCKLTRFLGQSGFRPIPPEGIQATYTVEYDRIDFEHVVLTGDFVLAVSQGDVNFDGQVNDDDLQAMRDYLFNRGEPVEFEEFMDIDGNGQINLMDMRELIKLIGE